MRVQFTDKTGCISWQTTTIAGAWKLMKGISAKQDYWHKSTVRIDIMQGNDVLLYWQKGLQ